MCNMTPILLPMVQLVVYAVCLNMLSSWLHMAVPLDALSTSSTMITLSLRVVQICSMTVQ